MTFNFKGVGRSDKIDTERFILYHHTRSSCTAVLSPNITLLCLDTCGDKWSTPDQTMRFSVLYACCPDNNSTTPRPKKIYIRHEISFWQNKSYAANTQKVQTYNWDHTKESWWKESSNDLHQDSTGLHHSSSIMCLHVTVLSWTPDKKKLYTAKWKLITHYTFVSFP